MPGITPSQTVGPFFAYGLDPKGRYDWVQTVGNDLITPDASGERIRIEGRVLDGDGAPVNDAMVEIWQADAAGRYAHPADTRRPNAKFTGFGRTGTEADGGFAFSTIKPGAVPGPEGKTQAPHILVAVFARGMLRHLYTRIYFADEAGNANDPVLALVPADRRATLTAKREEKSGRPTYVFDIRLQGEGETVFFEV
jgi:protocatechuate 3,4-dioxygenase, alpha subunit